jgi:membrane protease YdiL (CAAX protease family)
MTHGRRRLFAALMAAFVFVWALRATVFYDVVDRALPAGDFRVWFGLLAKLVLWTGSAVAYAHWVRHEPPLRVLRVTTPLGRRHLGSAVAAATLFLAAVTWDICRRGDLSVGALWKAALTRGIVVVTWTLLAALVEETFFRGLLLGELSEHLRFWPANFANATLFLLVHLPYWLWNRGLDIAVVRDSTGVFIIALVLGYLTRQTGSIWPATVVHTLNNLLAGAR